MNDEMMAFLFPEEHEVTREIIVKAPFSYPGGKNNALPMILPRLPVTDYYREPFGGSGIVLLNRPRVKNEYFNDRCSGVTDFYRCVKDQILVKRLLEWLDFSVCSREEFNRCRDTWKDISDPVERAGRWFISIVQSFQSYGRHYGRSKTAKNSFSMKLPSALSKFMPVHYRLQGVYIENQDWRQMFRDLNHHSAVWYLDPTYIGTEVSNLGMYEHVMTEKDHIAMCDLVFSQLEGYVALSGYDNPIYNRYPWDDKISWEQRETSSAKIGTESNNRKGSEGSNSGVRTECLWIKKFAD